MNICSYMYSCKLGYLWCMVSSTHHSFVKPSVNSCFHSAKCAYSIHVRRGIYDVGVTILLSSLLFTHISIQPSVLIFTCDDVPRVLTQCSWNLNNSTGKNPHSFWFKRLKPHYGFFWNDKSNRYQAFLWKPLETFNETMNFKGQNHAISIA